MSKRICGDAFVYEMACAGRESRFTVDPGGPLGYQ